MPDRRFTRVCSVVATEHDDIPIVHVAKVVAATLAEVDRIACDELEIRQAFHDAGLNPGTAA